MTAAGSSRYRLHSALAPELAWAKGGHARKDLEEKEAGKHQQDREPDASSGVLVRFLKALAMVLLRVWGFGFQISCGSQAWAVGSDG